MSCRGCWRTRLLRGGPACGIQNRAVGTNWHVLKCPRALCAEPCDALRGAQVPSAGAPAASRVASGAAV
eukprot:564753-Pyramimonas_sp.AAC.1